MLDADHDELPRPWTDAIDVHHHALPDFYLDELVALGSDVVVPGADRRRWRVEDSVAAMDRQGVRAAVLNVWPGVPVVDEQPAVRLARRVNDFLAELVAARPDRFGAFAVLPLPHVEASLAELERAVGELGLDGVGMVSHHGGRYPGDPAFEPVLAELDRRGAPLFVHPTVSPACGQPTFDLPASICEFPFETIRVAVQLLYNGVLDRYRRLSVILPHGGGGVAYYARRLALGPSIAATLEDRLPADPIAALRRLYVDVAMIGDDTAWPAVEAFFPPSNILMGSDFPFMSPEVGLENGRYIADAHAGDELLDRIAHRNAASLFPRFAPVLSEGVTS